VGERRTKHVVRDDDGNPVDLSKALMDALAEEAPDGDDGDVPESVVVDSLPDSPLTELDSSKTGEAQVLERLVRKGKFSPRTEYEMGACQMLVIRGYATTADNERFHPTLRGKQKLLRLKPRSSLRFGKF